METIETLCGFNVSHGSCFRRSFLHIGSIRLSTKVLSLGNVASRSHSNLDLFLFDIYSWMLYMTLQSLGGLPLSIENDASLHVNYAQQLEHIGCWKLAIFVLLHVNETTK
jgi:hypothetical protein